MHTLPIYIHIYIVYILYMYRCICAYIHAHKSRCSLQNQMLHKQHGETELDSCNRSQKIKQPCSNFGHSVCSQGMDCIKRKRNSVSEEEKW